MDRPLDLSVPTLHAGNTALIAWLPVEGANSYQLDRKINTEPTYTTVYIGPLTGYTDYLPDHATTASYRVQAAAQNNRPWDDIDETDCTWITLDALDWAWYREYSDWTASDTREVIPNRPPVISGQDGDIGTRYRGFSLPVSATDPDPNNTVHLVARLDDATVLLDMPNIQQGAAYPVTVSDSIIFAMPDQSRHTITITATDNKGATATRTQTFAVVEDVASTAVFYLLRDGVPVVKIPAANGAVVSTENLVAEPVHGETTETGTGEKSPDNPYIIRGVGENGVVPVVVSDGNASWTENMSVSAPLYSLPNGVRDEIDITSGQVIRRVGKAVLDGGASEGWTNWGRATETTNVFRSSVLPNCFDALTYLNPVPISTRCFSSHFRQSNSGNYAITDENGIWQIDGAEGREILAIMSNESVGIRVLKTRLSGWDDGWTNTQKVAAFRSWLSANPVTILYELAEPIIEPVQRRQFMRFNWQDYLAVGTHRYVIRGIDRYDNYSDSNEIVVTIAVNHAVIAPVDNPSDMITLALRRNERPTVSQSQETQYAETRYEGRKYPTYEHTGQRSKTISCEYSTRTLQEQQRLDDLLAVGGTLVYRDTYDNRVIGVVTSYNRQFQGRFRGRPRDAYTDFGLTISQSDYSEAVAYD